MSPQDDKKRPAALNLTPNRSASTDSSSSTSSLKPPRTPRFAEATSVHSPVDGPRSPFAMSHDQSEVAQSQPGDVGFGYMINNRESVAVPMTPRSPLKSAMRIPGTPARKFENPMSPTFAQEDMLEKREARTAKDQKKDLRIKMRVRMAKFALRGVSFSCSLIIISMLSASFAIFNATRSLPAQSNMPSWSQNTMLWPQILVIVVASISILGCMIVFCAYFRGGHKRAEKVATYYTMFAIGWFIVSLAMWAVSAGLFQHSRSTSQGQDMWGWSCRENRRADVFHDKVDYALVCRLNDWVLVCIAIEIVIEMMAIALYSIVFYRYYTKRKLHKSMDMRDKARSDLYLAQLRSQSAPNTPGLKSPGLYSQYALSPRNPEKTFASLGAIDEQNQNDQPMFTSAHFVEPPSSFAKEQSTFKLQAPPIKAPSATPKASQGGLTPTSTHAPSLPTEPLPTHPSVIEHQHMAGASDEPVYDAVPIPGAYADAPKKNNFGYR
ncbi:hypothetical protein F5X68DRAFT_229764 [Plectosphaerella plurivora]|uniref:Uncharacterized protein n=1 Tax=Plectosphaerella plurivora TaxID=936078 RepID=A0A9P9AET2_9PEZI|nr:hypothetical protein F5X68DRAFT_229764 [Plectosphaerella plurivora]